MAVHQAVGHQLAVHRVQGGPPHRVAGGDEADQRQHQQRGVQHLGLVVLGERPAFPVPTVVHDLGVDPVALGDPAAEVGGAAGEADHAVKRHPALKAAVGEVLAAAAGLPDALIGLVPVLADPVGELGELRPAGMADPDAVPVGEVARVQQLAVDVELELVGGAVADPHRPGAGVALPVVQGLLVQLGGAVDPGYMIFNGPGPPPCRVSCNLGVRNTPTRAGAGRGHSAPPGPTRAGRWPAAGPGPA
jgi:hypothetical protein